MLEVLRRGVASTQEEEAAEDSELQDEEWGEFEGVEERPLVGLNFDGKENEAENEDQKRERLDESALLDEEGTDGGDDLFAENRDDFPVVGRGSEAVVEEAIPLLDTPVLELRTLLSKDEPSNKREPHHPKQNSRETNSKGEGEMETSRGPTLFRQLLE